MTPFAERFARARAHLGPLVFGLDPSSAVLAGWGLEDSADGLDAFAERAVAAAAGTVAAVKPQAAFYERHGWRGVRALSRLAAEARSAGLLVILDAKRGDVGSTNQAYAAAYLGPEAGIPVDALTVSPYLGLGAMAPLVERAAATGSGLFVVTRSSNPEGRPLQQAREAGGRTVEEQIVVDIGALNRRHGPGVGPVGAVFAPTHGPPPGIDLAAMDGLFLAPGLGAQGASPADMGRCFAACPDRVLPSASRSLLSAGPDVARLRDALASLGRECADALGC